MSTPVRVGKGGKDLSGANVDGADLIIDVKTRFWGVDYFPFRLSKYRLNYSAQVDVTDAKTGYMVAQGFCKIFPESADNPPTYEEMFEKNAYRLKQEIAMVIETCSETIYSSMLQE